MKKNKDKSRRTSNYNFATRSFDVVEADAIVNVPTTAISYLRVSGKQQEEKWNWIKSQKFACKNYAKENDLELLDIFQDKAISWSKLERPWFESAIKYLEKKNKKEVTIWYFLCTEISRMARPEYVHEWLALIGRVWNAGTKVVDVNEGIVFSPEDDMQSLLLYIKIMQSKQERKSINTRADVGRRARMSEWYRPFSLLMRWYKFEKVKVGKKENSVVVKDYPYCDIVAAGLKKFASWELLLKKDLLDYYRENWLSSNKKQNHSGKLHASFIDTLLTPRRLYFVAGYIVYPDFGIDEPIKAKHEPLITEKELEKILDRLEEKPPRKEPIVKEQYKETYPLKRIVKCSACWNHLCGYMAKKKYHYYECKTKWCKLAYKSIRRDDIHDQFEDLITNMKVKKSVLDLMTDIAQKTIDEEIKFQDNVHEKGRGKILSIEKEMDRLMETMMKIKIPQLLDQYQEQWKLLNNKKISLERKCIPKEHNKKQLLELVDTCMTIVRDPVEVRSCANHDTKLVLSKIVFNEKLYYKKSQDTGSFRTPETRLFDRLLTTISDPPKEGNTVQWALSNVFWTNQKHITKHTKR